MYKPLPDFLTIKKSGIDGLGLFAKEDIAQGKNLGMTHISLNGMLLRTPMGGFINHDNDPNVVKVELLMTKEDVPQMVMGSGTLKVKFNYKKWDLVTLRDIKKGEELTVRYTFYHI